MPLLTINFNPDLGAILVVGIASPLSVLPPDSADLPTVHALRLLIDTGASSTSITPSMAERLGLPVLGKSPLRSVNHLAEANIYLADLFLTVFNPPLPLRDYQLLEMPLGVPDFDGLLGRDILRHGLFTMNGQDKTVTLAF